MSQQDTPDEPGAAPAQPPQRGPLWRLRHFLSQPTNRFALLFLLYLGAIALAYPSVRIRLTPSIEAAEDLTADIVCAVMSLFTDDVRMNHRKQVFFGKFVVTIIEECTGLYEALLLAAALLAFPTTWTKALLGFAIGFPMIYAMNILRICGLLVAGRYTGEYFDFLHLYFWQVTMILMVASTWLVWVVWVVRGDYERPAGTGAAAG